MKDEDKFKRIFQKVYFDLEGDRIIYDDFYSKEDMTNAEAYQSIPSDQTMKFEHYVQKYIVNHKGEFSQRGFSLPNRYQLQGKRSIVYKGIPLMVLVGIFYLDLHFCRIKDRENGPDSARLKAVLPQRCLSL